MRSLSRMRVQNGTDCGKTHTRCRRGNTAAEQRADHFEALARFAISFNTWSVMSIPGLA